VPTLPEELRYLNPRCKLAEVTAIHPSQLTT